MTNQLSKQFEEWLKEQDRSPVTIRGYLGDLRHFAEWFERTNGEQLRAENLTPTDARLYRQALIEARNKPATINRRIATLRTFGKMLMSVKAVGYDPVGEIRRVETVRTAPKWLDRKEQAAFTRELERSLGAAQTDPAVKLAVRDRAAMMLMLNTGLRVSEVAALDLVDVELSDRKGAIHVRSGKGEKARSVPLNKAARSALHAWLEIRPEREGGIWTGKRGDDLTTNGLQVRMERISQRLGFEITCHSLRHTFAKNLIDARVPITEVAMLLGHTRLETTAIYTVPSERDLEAAVRLLD